MDIETYKKYDPFADLNNQRNQKLKGFFRILDNFNTKHITFTA